MIQTTLLLAQYTGVDPNMGNGWLIRFLVWFAIGVIAGSAAGMIVDRDQEGIVRESVLGICGAETFGFFFSLIHMSYMLSFFLSIPVAVVGAIAFMWMWRFFIGGRPA